MGVSVSTNLDSKPKIIQGSNDPLVLEIDGVVEFEKISAVLCSKGNVIKEWSSDDAEIEGNYVILPLEENETLLFDKGNATLDIKGLDNKGKIVFMNLVEYIVVERFNKKRLTGD